MKGQGLVEYALILVLVAVVAIVILTLLSGGLCFEDKWTCQAKKVDQCLASEKFTREECIQMVSGDDSTTTIIIPTQ